jgi:hypothetical protein
VIVSGIIRIGGHRIRAAGIQIADDLWGERYGVDVSERYTARIRYASSRGEVGGANDDGVAVGADDRGGDGEI